MTKSFFRKFRVLAAFACVAVAADFAVPAVFAAPEEDAASLPSTCIPKSRESEKWWKDRNDGFNKIAQERSAKILFLGDSITHYWTVRGYQKWQYGKDSWDKYFAPLDAVAFGCSGDKTENVLWRLDSGNLSGKMDPKLIVLMIGTNNKDNAPEDTAQGIKAILERIEKARPNAKVLLLAVFPRGETKDDPKRKTNDAVNAIIKKYADNKRVFWLDIGKKFLKKDAKQTLPKDIMPDLLHPNAKGYEIWAKAIVAEVKRLSR